MFERLKLLLKRSPQAVFNEHLVTARNQYLTAYRQALSTYRKRFKPSAPEVIFDLNKHEVPKHFRHYRVDLASGAVSPPNLTEVNIAQPIRFDSQTFDLQSGMSVTLKPFVWNGLDIFTAPFESDSPEFVSWCLKWLDLDDKRTPDGDGFCGVIHCVMPPAPRGDCWGFTVDFGTAPIAALEELLSILQSLGVSSVTLGSFHFDKRAGS